MCGFHCRSIHYEVNIFVFRLSTAIAQCKRVFLSLNVLAAEEMANIAATIFAPVRMGVVYPSSPFSLGTIPDSSSVSDELFSILPLPERSSVPYSQSTRVRFANTLTVEGGQPEEEEEMEAEVWNVEVLRVFWVFWVIAGAINVAICCKFTILGKHNMK